MFRTISLAVTLLAGLGLVGLFILALPTSAAQQVYPGTTIVVNTLNDELDNNGFCSLREAITAANDNTATGACPAGDGVLTDTVTFDINGTILLTEELSVMAGGPLVIDGGETITVSGNNSVRVFSANPGSNLTFIRIAITEGGSDWLGGGLYNNGGVVNIVTSTFHGNFAYDGGGIYNDGFIYIYNSFLSGNNVNSKGGGIFNHGTMQIFDSILVNNEAGFSGGGIANHQVGVLEITGSSISNNNSDAYGGGIDNQSSHLNVSNSSINDNSAGDNESGGGIMNWSEGPVSITNSTISGNSAHTGAGIYSYGSVNILESIISDNISSWRTGGIESNGHDNTLEIINSSITGNIAVQGCGGICSDGALTVISSTISGNSAEIGGIGAGGISTIISSTISGNSGEGAGGISTGYSAVEVIDSIIVNNSADVGGGINAGYGELFIINGEINDNYAETGGGIHISGEGSIKITNTIISGNSTLYAGGGIYDSEGTINISNSTISENSSDGDGGGVHIFKGWLSISDSTLSNNFAGEDGDSIYSDNPVGIPSPMINNTLIANRSSNANCFGQMTDNGHNIESANSCGFDPANGSMINTDPRIGPLQDNGGPTWIHALLPDSPAIDAADPTNCPTTDQRGVQRPLDGDQDGTAICDIGSYELGMFLDPAIHYSSAAPGTTVDHKIALVNYTDLTDTYTLTLGSSNWKTDLSAETVGPLQSGESQLFTVSVTIPVTATAYMTDTVIVSANSITHPKLHYATAELTTQSIWSIYIPFVSGTN